MSAVKVLVPVTGAIVGGIAGAIVGAKSNHYERDMAIGAVAGTLLGGTVFAVLLAAAFAAGGGK